MKTTCCIILCFVAFSLAPVLGADSKSATVNIDQKLRDIDLKLMLRQYEKVKKQHIDLRFQETLLQTEDMTDDERKKQTARMSKRDAVLVQELNELILRIRHLGAESVKASK